MSVRTSWNGRTTSFSTAIRRATLARDRTCTCDGCPQCGVGGCGRESAIVDHRVPYVECVRAGTDPNIPDNARGMCVPCHDVKTRQEIARGKARLRPRLTLAHPSDPS